MNIFCPLVAPLAEKINFTPKQKFCEFQRICHIYVSNWALCVGPKQLCALAHLGCTHEAGTSYF